MKAHKSDGIHQTDKAYNAVGTEELIAYETRIGKQGDSSAAYGFGLLALPTPWATTSNRLKAWALATHILFALIIGIAIVLTLSIGVVSGGLAGGRVDITILLLPKEGFGNHRLTTIENAHSDEWVGPRSDEHPV